MKTILGLDISSSTIGWSILEYNDKQIILKEYGHIKPPKSNKGSLTFRASAAYDEVYEFLLNKKPDIVASEAYANKFPRGRSTARTIIVLSVFNELVSMACLKSLNYEPEKYAVMTIRSMLSKLAGYKITSKEDCFEFIKKYFSNYSLRNNKNGKIAKECYDEADAIAVALTYILKERSNG
jgi:Holliday junction resolvasome RuvABC endonuclease subunit